MDSKQQLDDRANEILRAALSIVAKPFENDALRLEDARMDDPEDDDDDVAEIISPSSGARPMEVTTEDNAEGTAENISVDGTAKNISEGTAENVEVPTDIPLEGTAENPLEGTAENVEVPMDIPLEGTAENMEVPKKNDEGPVEETAENVEVPKKNEEDDQTDTKSNDGKAAAVPVPPSGSISSDESQSDDGYSSSEDDEPFGPEDTSNLTEEQIQAIVDRLLEVEAECLKAQEAREDESLECVKKEVHEELATTLSGSKLEEEVEQEMRIYLRSWDETLEALELESGELQDKLDHAGIDLPTVFKTVDKQAAEGCVTEAWRNRTHWVGLDASHDYAEVRKQAETQLNIMRPVMTRRGKLVEEGASGFLKKKINLDNPEGSDVWKILDGVRDPKTNMAATFSTKEWAAVYSASTPEQAVRLGLKFPGVDKVEEIGDVDGNAEITALAEESKYGLTEEQKKSLKRVREEDDLRRVNKKPAQDIAQSHNQVSLETQHIAKSQNKNSLEDRQEIAQSQTEENVGTKRTKTKPVLCEVIEISDDEGDDVPATGVSNVEKSSSISKVARENLVSDDATSPLNKKRPRQDDHLPEKNKKRTGLQGSATSDADQGKDGSTEVSSGAKSSDDNVTGEEAATGVDQKPIHFASSRKHRKNIKKVLSDDLLNEQTRHNLAIEKERRERLDMWYEEAATKQSGKTKTAYDRGKTNATDNLNDDNHLCEGDCANLGCVLNIVGRKADEPLIRIPTSISRVLKSYQLSGVRFMWDNCMQTVSKVTSGNSEGLGCILAHSMGLGKTLQVIAFLYTVMKAVDLGFKTAMVVLPVNVLHNWSAEFIKWKPKEVEALPVYMVEDASRRVNSLGAWKIHGGVLLIGYATFRSLTQGRNLKDKAARDLVCECLQNPGPDLLVCDEAHTVKNPKANITLALKSVKTKRRIALTGSPLQNNLLEYYCMVDFVREGFLGASAEFRNRFQNPIENGQHKDSTASDVRKMKQRAHVLHEQLKGFVQRRDMSVLKDEMPPKCVWVISVKLSQLQKTLYKKYISLCERHESSLFDVYSSLAKVWNHPDLLPLSKGKDDHDSLPEEEDIENEENAAASKQKALKAQTDNWWQECYEGVEQTVLEHSGKMKLVLKLLFLSAAQGEKVLIFSQSLATLDLLETFLKNHSGETGHTWTQGMDWYRMEGKTKPVTRQHIVDRFNDVSNTLVKCVLISTKAGSLGINLVGASRVIIMDGSWNPTHDLQALFRAWRIGQKKPVHVYRLLAYGTMEEKIYNRQLAKESVSKRVLDEHQVGRHLKADDLDILYTLDDDDDDDEAVMKSETTTKKSREHPTFCVPSDAPPRDDLLALLLLEFRPQWIAKYHEHEPLLENLEDEMLTNEDKLQAWEEVNASSSKPGSDGNVPTVQTNPTACEVLDHVKLLQRLSSRSGICEICRATLNWTDLQRKVKAPKRITPESILAQRVPQERRDNFPQKKTA